MHKTISYNFKLVVLVKLLEFFLFNLLNTHRKPEKHIFVKQSLSQRTFIFVERENIGFIFVWLIVNH